MARNNKLDQGTVDRPAHLTLAQYLPRNSPIHIARRTLRNSESGFPHTHGYYELFMVVEGRVLQTVNGHEQVVESGQALFMKPGDMHYYHKDDAYGEAAFINAGFPPEMVDECTAFCGWKIGALSETLPRIISGISESVWSACIGKLERIEDARLSYSQKGMIFKLVVLDMLLMASKSSHGRSARPAAPDWLQRSLDTLRLPRYLTIGHSALTMLTGKSYEHLCRVMKRCYGLTPTQYVNELRLRGIARNLVDSERSIIELALEGGYNNLSYFNAVFKAHYGMCPRDYRKARAVS